MRLPHNTIAWIRNAGRSSITDQGDLQPALKFLQKETSLFILVVFVVARRGLVDVVVHKEPRGVTGILTRDQVHFAQHTQCPERDVFQVPDWRGDHIKGSRHVEAYSPQSRK